MSSREPILARKAEGNVKHVSGATCLEDRKTCDVTLTPRIRKNVFERQIFHQILLLNSGKERELWTAQEKKRIS